MVPVLIALAILSFVPIARWFPEKHEADPACLTHDPAHPSYEMKD